MASRLAYRNWAWEPGVTITSSADATGYPASNLSSSAPWKIWRSSAAATDQWVKFDLGSARAMTACMLRTFLLHVGGSVKVQMNSSDVWVTPPFEQTFTVPSPSRTKVLAAFFSVQTYRWVRILFVNTGPVAQAVELGVAFPTSYYEPPNGFSPGIGFERTDLSLVVSAVGGQEQVDQRGQRFKLSVDPRQLAASERDTFLLAFDTVGIFAPWFLVLDSTNANLIVYGKWQGGLPVAHNAESLDLWTAPFTFVEEL